MIGKYTFLVVVRLGDEKLMNQYVKRRAICGADSGQFRLRWRDSLAQWVMAGLLVVFALGGFSPVLAADMLPAPEGISQYAPT
jgi:hypothetical protein